MSLMYILLLAALGFAVLMLLLFGIYFVKNCLCPPSRNSESGENGSGDGYSSIEVRYENPHGRFGQLTSRPSAPILSEMDDRRTTSTPRVSIDEHHMVEEIRAIQTGLIRHGIHNDDEEGCKLIIGVDANPHSFGGYCVNLMSKCVEYYSLLADDLPFRFGTSSTESAEFEMKNFLFALMLWRERIEEAKKFRIYTGNHVISYDNNRYARRATKLLEHYSGCEGITVLNENRFHVNRRSDPKSFGIYIQPAEDLSRSNLLQFRNFISAHYNIRHTQFFGSCYIPAVETTDQPDGLDYERTEKYGLYISKVREEMTRWIEPCHKCGYVDDETASMLNINMIG